jgi:hypothetical protein
MKCLKSCRLPLFVGIALAALATTALAVTVPYTEDFATNNANWQNNASGLLTYVASGGPDGSSYASGTRNFQSVAADGTSVLFRANDTTPFGPASGGNFHGNWIADGATRFSTYVRHNAPTPVSFFARFADPAGFPALIFSDSNIVVPNTWTKIDFVISPGNPHIDDEGFPFGDVMDSIGRVQVGAYNTGLAGLAQTITFDIDQVNVNIPEPATMMLSGLATVTGCFIRRRTR